MYHPVWQNKFKDVIDLSGGKFTSDKSPAARKKLASHLNDNVFMNIEKFSLRLFDQDRKYRKTELGEDEKAIVVNQLVDENTVAEQISDLHTAIDRILILHRNTKLFFFLMSGPFCLMLLAIKWSFKAAILHFIYKKAKKEV